MPIGSQYTRRVKELLALTLRLAGARWPTLMTLFLAGWILRYIAIYGAALVGSLDRFAGLLILPIAVLARLLSYVAILLVLAGTFKKMGQGLWRNLDTDESHRYLVVLGKAVVPFFAAYTVLGFLEEDSQLYEFFGQDFVLAQALSVDLQEEVPRLYEFRNLFVVIPVVVFAWLARRLLRKYREKLPDWIVFIEVYFEALWVYLTLRIINDWFSTIPQWVNSRQAMAWLGEWRTGLVEAVPAAQWVWTNILVPVQAALTALTGALGAPFAWLLLVGTVYGSVVAPVVVSWRRPRSLEIAQRRWQRLPGVVRARLAEAATSGPVKPLHNAITVMIQAGPLLLGTYVLLYAIVDVAGQSLFAGAVRLLLLSPLADSTTEALPSLDVVTQAMVEPLRVGLVVAVYLISARRLAEYREKTGKSETGESETGESETGESERGDSETGEAGLTPEAAEQGPTLQQEPAPER